MSQDPIILPAAEYHGLVDLYEKTAEERDRLQKAVMETIELVLKVCDHDHIDIDAPDFEDRVVGQIYYRLKAGLDNEENADAH